MRSGVSSVMLALRFEVNATTFFGLHKRPLSVAVLIRDPKSRIGRQADRWK